MNSVSYKNTSYLKKIITNFEILEAFRLKDIDKINKILNTQKNGKNTSQPKFEPHFQNLDLVDFFINNNVKRILRKFHNNEQVFEVVQEFIKLGTSPDPIGKGLYYPIS
jgi:hypothetical protein